MNFEWDPRKSEINLRKHSVSITEAATIFGDELAVTVLDPDHSNHEERFITIGWSNRHRLLIVSHSDLSDRIRIISARELTPGERKNYEEEIN